MFGVKSARGFGLSVYGLARPAKNGLTSQSSGSIGDVSWVAGRSFQV